MENCLFCQIEKKELPSQIVYENERIVAFRDINPKAPVHILIIPRKHIPTINDIESHDMELLGELFLIAKNIAAQENLSERGYRLIFNCNRDAGQEVYHIHLHLLGGRPMGWPPG